MMKTISVVMPSYNYAHYLPQALEALLNQTVKPLEIIVIDDKSTDNSVEVVKAYQEKSPLIHLYHNEENQGVIATANRGIDLAKGDYIVFCAVDDETCPTFFEKGLDLLNKYPEAGIFASRYCIFFDEAPDKLSYYSALLSQKEAYLSPEQFIKRIKMNDIHIGGLNTIFRKNALVEAGKFLPELKHMCDWFLIYALSFRYGACFAPEALAKARIHKKAYSQAFIGKKHIQASLFAHIDHLLSEGDFQDIHSSFVDSGIMYQVGLPLSTVINNHRKFVNTPFLWQSGIYFLKTCKSFILRNLLKR